MYRKEMNAPTVLIVIPARYASTRFPGKPLADIAGISMIERVYTQCTRAQFSSRVIVATDDERIASEVHRFGGEFCMTPSEVASGTERVAIAVKHYHADIIVNVQGDEPLIPHDTIDQTIEPLINNSEIEIGTAATAVNDTSDIRNPNVVKVVRSHTGRALYFSRAPIPFLRDASNEVSFSTYLKHVGIYAFRRSSLEQFTAFPISPLENMEKLEQLRALENGMYIHVALVTGDSIAVDVPEDIGKVLAHLRQETTH